SVLTIANRLSIKVAPNGRRGKRPRVAAPDVERKQQRSVVLNDPLGTSTQGVIELLILWHLQPLPRGPLAARLPGGVRSLVRSFLVIELLSVFVISDLGANRQKAIGRLVKSRRHVGDSNIDTARLGNPIEFRVLGWPFPVFSSILRLHRAKP